MSQYDMGYELTAAGEAFEEIDKLLGV